MKQRMPSSISTSYFCSTVLASILMVALASCGGSQDSDSGGTAKATVSSMSITATKYANPATIVINGTGLDNTLALSSSVCTNFVLKSGNTAQSATYTCTVSGGLTGAVVAKSNGTQVGSATLTVPAPVVTMSLNNGLAVNGNLVITLAPDKAPKTVDNFLHYVNTSFYNNTIYHRVVPGFIMQGGGYAPQITDVSTATLKSGLFSPVALESTGLSNVQWSIAMANANTSSNTTTTTSQFYINLVNNTHLDGGYAVFGAITAASTSVAQAVVAAPGKCVNNAQAGTTDCLPIPNVVVVAATQTQ
jgi:peptidyl-prolyl cis-trans isomerase A (cyclophilin A)